jgi:hypothetical protein
MDSDSYCREIEAHLCRKNAGHLVRVVGPAFQMVTGWATQGIPLKVALRGIDRCVERREARAPSRRPLRVEFCEADVLDVFDQWRRAVGVGTAGGGAFPVAAVDAGAAGEPAGEDRRTKPGHSLRAHLDRVVTRLTDRVAGGALGGELERAVESILAELGEERSLSRNLRGEARAAFIARLQAIDDELLAAACQATPADVMNTLRVEAEQDLAGFRDRMPAQEYARAVEAATIKLLRDRLKLPDVAYGP